MNLFDFNKPIETDEEARDFYIAVGCDTGGAADGVLARRLSEYRAIGLSHAEEDEIASSEIRRICRDINNGYFSKVMSDDVRELRRRFFKCGVRQIKTPKGLKTIYNRSARKKNIRQIYFALLNFVKYEMTDADRIAVCTCMIGNPDPDFAKCGCRGFALAAKKYGERLIASDFLKLSGEVLSEIEKKDDYALEIETMEQTMKIVRRHVRWGRYDKSAV